MTPLAAHFENGRCLAETPGAILREDGQWKFRTNRVTADQSFRINCDCRNLARAAF